LNSSSGPDSLSIWTHNIRGIEVKKNDTRAVALGGVASVKISAGMNMFEIYVEAVKNNITVVGGGDVAVGIGGWITGGGHSPISSKFGLGADQVLEMEVVTADGKLRTINATTNPDLFWAMRGVSSQLSAPRLSSNRTNILYRAADQPLVSLCLLQ
jgi:FAD/FMN-containing dehydrogenase